ncbi:HD family phosphohydrolase [Magnetospira sp. QH-2]|uniref:HD family phosphohydrolase n=1 Tax=Magnetospira sp. (strain QH-2) TaxID=1288970 RepID=UPI0003E818E8|nr:HD family phosphohydrolase [Magnetospira sp. QH-2]CCQ74636.1 HD-GYP domain containing protein [Magnetospira sp. QH-2]
MSPDASPPGGPQMEWYQRLLDTGIALSSERNHDKLMELILHEAKDLCHADGGTLYLRTEKDTLKFVIMLNDSLNIAMGGTTGKDIPFPPLEMYREDGRGNHNNVATHVAISKETINIPDAYEAEDFDFSGTRKFDQGTGYRSKSFLTVPLMNHKEEVIGVLQLLNSQNPETGEVVEFSQEIQPIIESLSSQAAVALDNQQLISAQKDLLASFIQMIAGAIDAKSPYTGGHCQRVPELTKMLARAACESSQEPFAEFDLEDDGWEELHIAAWLHDCGKVTTPEAVVDKATKLECIYDRIHEIRMRFEVLKRDAELDFYRDLKAGKGSEKDLQAALDARLAQLDEDFAFVAECNLGGEFMAPEKVDRLKEIAQENWTRTLDDTLGLAHEELQRYAEDHPRPPVVEPLLADRPHHLIAHDKEQKEQLVHYNEMGFNMVPPPHKSNRGELHNLAIGRGTLTDEDRFKINDHIVQTIFMLGALPFPKHLKNVPEYAGGHHEKMDGGGYPRGLKKKDMSLPARIMAIADIFEALTAADRPYKQPKKLSDAIRIMSFMTKDSHIDADLFQLFLSSGIYQEYATLFLKPEQLDEVDISQYLSQAAE